MIAPFLAMIAFTGTALFATSQESWEEIRPIAEAQHEIVLLLIERKEFDKVPGAAREIFHLGFPEAQEHRLVKEAEILTNALLHHNQTRIAHQVLDDALLSVKTRGAKAKLHREKAYVYKKEGNTDEAMRQFELAVALKSDDSEP
jgi:tetratricopeptide (TPR) repeat protein